MPITIIVHFHSLICNMLQQLQRSIMEESEPIHSDAQLQGEYQADVRKQKEGIYGRSDGEKRISFIEHFKKKYVVYFSGITVVLLGLIILELCFNGYLTRAREDNFDHNMQILKQWEQRKQAAISHEKLAASTTANTVTNLKTTFTANQPQLEPPHIEIEHTPLNNQVQSLLKSSQVFNNYITQQASKQGPVNHYTPVTTVFPTLNNQFDFQSDSLYDQSFNTPQPPEIPQVIFSAIDQSTVQKGLEQAIPQVEYIYSSNPNQIDYSNWTGINIDQVSNSLIWMQLKYYPISQANPLADSQRDYYEKKYNTSKYGELPICVVVPSFNNAADNRHINNINSILMQEYSNYRVVFIDDASTDSTATDVFEIISKQTKLTPRQYVIVRNVQQKKAMFNLRMAANSYCQPEEIFIVVDGDDELIGRQVLKLFNAVFQQSGAWFVYTNFLTAKNYIGFSRMVPPSITAKNAYRKYPFVTSHLRAFYTQLFRNIKEQDLEDSEGEYLQAANDVAICLPILEQAQDRVFYLPELTYFYNSDTGLNNHFLRLQEQKKNDLRLRNKQPYSRLNKLFT